MNNWKKEAEEIRENARYAPLKILVWGPGNPGPGASDEKRRNYEKRVQIRDVLRNEFHRAKIFFSEDPEMIEIAENISPQLRKEALQAKVANLVLMLDMSRGADLELDYFVPTYPWFRDKVHVFLPEKSVPPKGFVKQVFDHLREDQVEGFTDQEFEECSVAKQKAVRIVEIFCIDYCLRR